MDLKEVLEVIAQAEELAKEKGTTVTEEFEILIKEEQKRRASLPYEQLVHHNEVNHFYIRRDGTAVLKIYDENSRTGMSQYIFDSEAYERVIKTRWYINKEGYAVNENGVYLHDVVMQPKPGEFVYFVNRDMIYNNMSYNLGITDRRVVYKRPLTSIEKEFARYRRRGY